MRLVAALLRGAFWFVLCVCVTHWSCVFCDCVPRLRSVFLYCVCVSRYPFVSASCICVLRFPAASPVTQSLCSLRDFFRCSLHSFLRSAVGFVPTCRTLSLAGRGVIALTHCSVSALSLLTYLYRLADLTARTPQIAPCLTWILSGLEFALCLVRSGVHHYWSPPRGGLVKISSSRYCQTYNLRSHQVFPPTVESLREQLADLDDTPSSPSPKPQPPLAEAELTVVSHEPSPLDPSFLTMLSLTATPPLTPTNSQPLPLVSVNVSASIPTLPLVPNPVSLPPPVSTHPTVFLTLNLPLTPCL